VKLKGRVGRARVSLFGRLLLDIVERAPPSVPALSLDSSTFEFGK
jgi:hypothetical protein